MTVYWYLMLTEAIQGRGLPVQYVTVSHTTVIRTTDKGAVPLFFMPLSHTERGLAQQEPEQTTTNHH